MSVRHRRKEILYGNGLLGKVNRSNPPLLSARSMAQSAMMVECE